MKFFAANIFFYKFASVLNYMGNTLQFGNAVLVNLKIEYKQ